VLRARNPFGQVVLGDLWINLDDLLGAQPISVGDGDDIVESPM